MPELKFSDLSPEEEAELSEEDRIAYILERLPETAAASEEYLPDVQSALLIQRKELQRQAAMGDYVVSKETNARLRAMRGNMFKRLDRAYDLYQEFTAANAADRLKVKLAIIEDYLMTECVRPGARISHLGDGRYCIINPFAQEVERMSRGF